MASLGGEACDGRSDKLNDLW